MKIAICSTGTEPESLVADRFARADYFAIYDSKTLQFSFVDNSAKREGSGAGGKAVKVLGDLDVEIVLVPELGPKAIDALVAFDIKSFQYKQGETVRAALYSYFEKKLPEMLESSVQGKH